MAPKRTHNLVQETMVKESTQELDVPFEAIKEEEQEDFEEQKNYENFGDHENEKKQLTTILFIPKQLEVLF